MEKQAINSFGTCQRKFLNPPAQSMPRGTQLACAVRDTQFFFQSPWLRLTYAEEWGKNRKTNKIPIKVYYIPCLGYSEPW